MIIKKCTDWLNCDWCDTNKSDNTINGFMSIGKSNIKHVMTCQCFFVFCHRSQLSSGFFPYRLSPDLAISALVCLGFAFHLLSSLGISFSWHHLFLAFAHIQTISTSSLRGIVTPDTCVPLSILKCYAEYTCVVFASTSHDAIAFMFTSDGEGNERFLVDFERKAVSTMLEKRDEERRRREEEMKRKEEEEEAEEERRRLAEAVPPSDNPDEQWYVKQVGCIVRESCYLDLCNHCLLPNIPLFCSFILARFTFVSICYSSILYCFFSHVFLKHFISYHHKTSDKTNNYSAVILYTNSSSSISFISNALLNVCSVQLLSVCCEMLLLHIFSFHIIAI